MKAHSNTPSAIRKREKYRAEHPPKTEMDKFFAKINRNQVTGCWEWTAATTSFGYGVVRVGWNPGVLMGAHRFSYLRHKGEIPEGMFVCHACDNPRCCNPDHLFLGTHADNMRDCQTKGRNAVGERHGNAKLTDAQADEIRRRYKRGNGPALAKEFGVCQQSVSLIVTGKRRAA